MSRCKCWVSKVNDSMYFDNPGELIRQKRLKILNVEELFISDVIDALTLTEAVADYLEKNDHEVVLFVDDWFTLKKENGKWVLATYNAGETLVELEKLGITCEDWLITDLPKEFRAIEIYDSNTVELIIYKPLQIVKTA